MTISLVYTRVPGDGQGGGQRGMFTIMGSVVSRPIWGMERGPVNRPPGSSGWSYLRRGQYVMKTDRKGPNRDGKKCLRPVIQKIQTLLVHDCYSHAGLEGCIAPFYSDAGPLGQPEDSPAAMEAILGLLGAWKKGITVSLYISNNRYGDTDTKEEWLATRGYQPQIEPDYDLVGPLVMKPGGKEHFIKIYR